MITLSDDQIQELKPEPRAITPVFNSIKIDEQEAIRENNFGDLNAPTIEGSNPYLDELATTPDLKPRSLARDALQIHNVTTNLAYWYGDSQQKFEDDVNYDPYRDDRELFNQMDLDSRERMNEAKSPAELRYILKRIDGERRARQNIDEHGTEGFLASLAAGIIDPVSFIPLVGASTKARMLYAAGTVATEELIMHQAQNDRTLTESALNIGTAGILVGGLSHLMSKYGARSVALKELESNIKSVSDDIDIVDIPVPKDAGAAKVSGGYVADWNDETLTPVGGSLTKVASFGPLGGLAGRLMFSALTPVKKLTNELFDHPFVLRGHKLGLSEQSVESSINAVNNKLAHEITTAKRTYLTKFIEAGSGTQDDFLKAVNRELRYADSIDPNVKAASQSLRKMYDDMGKILHDHEKIANPDNVFGALHFAPRDYNKVMMRSNPDTVIKDIANKLYTRWSNNPKEMQKVIDDSMNAKMFGTPAEVIQAVREEADEIAESVYKHIIDGANEFPATTGRRKLRLEDEDLMDYIELDPYATAAKYMQRTTPKVILLKRYSTWNSESIMKAAGVDDASLELMKKDGGKNALKMYDKGKSDQEALKAGIDRLLGIKAQTGLSRKLESAASAYSKFGVMTKMGSALISSINDVGNTVMINGPIKASKYYIEGLLDILDKSNLSKSQAKSLASAFEEMTSARMKAITDLIEEPVSDPVNEWMSVIANGMMRLSGLPAWTRYGQEVSARIGVDKIYNATQALKAGKKLSKSEITYLAQHGLSTNMLTRVEKQMSTYSTPKLLKTHNWKDIEAAEAVEAAIGRMVNGTVIKPGVTTLSKSFDNPIIKLLFQFQTFAFASWQKVAIAGLQRHDANFAMAAMMIAGLGMMQLKLKEKINGRELPKDWGEFAWSAVQETGIGALPLNMYDKFGGVFNLPTTNKMMNIGKAYESRGGFDENRVFGVALQPVLDIGKIIDETLIDGKATQKSIDATRRLMPLNNLWYLNSLFDQISRASADGLDIRYKSRDSLINKAIEGR